MTPDVPTHSASEVWFGATVSTWGNRRPGELMADIVLSVAASHAPGLAGLYDGAPEETKAEVDKMYGTLEAEIAAADLDVLIVIGNDHLANSRVLEYPDFLVGMAAEHTGPYEWFKPWLNCRDYSLIGRPDVAEAVISGMAQRGIKFFGRRENLRYDDNLSIPTVLCNLDSHGVPVMPILQNCTVPPIPDQRDCYRVGEALGDIIHNDLPDGMRVGLFGSGGMSHEPGGKRYFFIDEEFDQWFLGLLENGDHAQLLAEVTPERMEQSGEGGTAELFAWFVVLGAIGNMACSRLGYTAYDNFKCGVGAVRWEMGAR
ncbi:MAG: aromatic ring-opening dioxygenase catalytic subunit (LigB family) [Candidatus Poriferisodalaceae bacterium]|jgi:aromatic ring-opening dioxygenase catalytic subunit (LigB family)